LNRPFEVDHKFFVALTAVAFVPFDKPKSLRHEVALWKAAGDRMGEVPLDAAMTKTRGEILAAGDACATGSEPIPGTPVRLSLLRNGKVIVDKQLYVFGDRRWETSGMTQPVPFLRMPVSAARAFGGEGLVENPHGRSLKPTIVDGTKVHWLPNVEDPQKLVKSPSDKPAPAGFGPLDMTHPARMKHVGTYDQKWLGTRYPGPPEDFHWEHHNAAPEDQRITGFFEGNEKVRIEGMSPHARIVEMDLPPLVAKFIVLRKGKEDTFETEEHTGRLDTVFAFPTDGAVALFFRASVPVTEDDAEDVHTTMIALEEAGKPKSREHYRDCLRARMDPEKGVQSILNDHELLPDWPIDAKKELMQAFGDESKNYEMEGILMANADRRVDRELEEARAKIVAEGGDPAVVDARTEQLQKARADRPPDTFEALGPYVARKLSEAEQARADAEERKKQAEDEAREKLKKLGLDYDKLKAEQKRKTGPPDCLADQLLERLRDTATLIKNAGGNASTLDAQLADKEFERKLREVEARILAGYRFGAHMFDPIAPEALDPELRARRRDELQAALTRGAPIGSLDLTGADLRGLDLRGAKLAGALLEDALLDEVDLSGADLSSAVLTRASLTKTKLAGAKLTDTNLGGAKAREADFSGANLADAICIQTDFTGANLREAELSRAQMNDADLSGATLERAKGKALMLSGAKLAEAKLDGADFSDAVFMKCDLERASLAGTTLGKATFAEGTARGASFAGADLRNTRFVLGIILDGCDLKGARLGQTLLRGCSMVEADLAEVDASLCDFSDADLTRAKMRKLIGKSCLFIRTKLLGTDLRSADLMSACLQKARLGGADFRGANLFRTDFARAVGDDQTRFGDAYIAEVRTVPDPSKRRLFG
jgi:uncharacterized protein YjbI with pentapeptide repeats